jgi:hypothetical protein
MKLGGGWSRRVFVGEVAVAALAMGLLANCSGGERPPPAVENLPPDAGGSPPIVAGNGLTIEGFDPNAGIIIGDNGFTNCGAQSSAKTLTIRNANSDVVNFTATLTAGKDFYKINSGEGVPAKGFVEVQIVPNPIPATSDVVADQYAGTLEIKFATGEPATVIRLHQTARGAIVKSTVVQNLLDFGDVRLNTNGTLLFSLTNAGNGEVTASYQVGSQQFQIDGAGLGSGKLGGGETSSKSLTFRPVAVQAYTDTLALTYNTAAVHCAVPPGNVALKGKGTTAVSVSPGTLNFGDTLCGGRANFQTITISSSQAVNLTPTLGDGVNSMYELADGAGTTVPLGAAFALAANTPYVMRIVPKVVAPPVTDVAVNGIGDTLTIASDIPSTHTVDLRQTAKGAILEFNPIGAVPPTANTIQIINRGNLATPYVLRKTEAGIGSFDPPSGNLEPGTTPVLLRRPIGEVSFQPGVPGAILCQDLPAPVVIN